MATWTSQEPQIATEDHLKLRWSGGRPGERFRCYLCGHKFKVGDRWRFVFGGKVCSRNLMVCKACDGDDVRERFAAGQEELRTRFWWALDPDRCSAM